MFNSSSISRSREKHVKQTKTAPGQAVRISGHQRVHATASLQLWPMDTSKEYSPVQLMHVPDTGAQEGTGAPDAMQK